ncbi:MAG TPA: DUF4118 domain-containing protein, partial [Propionibacteriaceae bacterium]|nr:DUF4118 domain-containing protein [Propionibacteriaceae bacterium]
MTPAWIRETAERLRRATGISRTRQSVGILLALVGLPLLTGGLLVLGSAVQRDTALLAYLLLIVVSSAVGGWPASLVAVLGGFMSANFFFTPPYHSLSVANRAELIDLLVFLAVATLVAFTTEAGARSRARAEGARLEAGWLAELSSRQQGAGSLEAALDDARRVFGMSAVALLDGKEVVGEVGAPEPHDIEVSVDAGDNRRLVMWGTPRVGEDRRLMGMIAATAGRLWQTEQLAAQARRAEELARIDEVRVALLAAVGHDLRSPLAAIKASVSTLLQSDIEMLPSESEQLLAGIDDNTDRLNDLVSNLLDMSRIQAGAVSVQLRPTAIEESLEGALKAGGDSVDLDLPEGLPLVIADPGLLERVLANLVDNARRFLPETGRVAIRARARDGWLRVE